MQANRPRHANFTELAHGMVLQIMMASSGVGKRFKTWSMLIFLVAQLTYNVKTLHIVCHVNFLIEEVSLQESAVSIHARNSFPLDVKKTYRRHYGSSSSRFIIDNRGLPQLTDESPGICPVHFIPIFSCKITTALQTLHGAFGDGDERWIDKKRDRLWRLCVLVLSNTYLRIMNLCD